MHRLYSIFITGGSGILGERLSNYTLSTVTGFWLTSTTNCSENCGMSNMKTLSLSALQLSMNS